MSILDRPATHHVILDPQMLQYLRAIVFAELQKLMEADRAPPAPVRSVDAPESAVRPLRSELIARLSAILHEIDLAKERR
jgi:hypothetical protein